MINSEGLKVVIEIGVVSTALFGSLVYARHRIIFGSAKARKKREETKEQTLRSLDALVTVGEMNRFYYNLEDNCYRDYTGKQVSTQPLKQDIKKIGLYAPEGLGSLITEMECKGKALRADAYSLTEPEDIHGAYTFGVLYHRLNRVDNKPVLHLVDSAVK
ncbi:MAG: hypothetical protein AABY26_03545 [Nanoarchaeota archaeon]